MEDKPFRARLTSPNFPQKGEHSQAAKIIFSLSAENAHHSETKALGKGNHGLLDLHFVYFPFIPSPFSGCDVASCRAKSLFFFFSNLLSIAFHEAFIFHQSFDHSFVPFLFFPSPYLLSTFATEGLCGYYMYSVPKVFPAGKFGC